jgi:hypothetical protein
MIVSVPFPANLNAPSMTSNDTTVEIKTKPTRMAMVRTVFLADYPLLQKLLGAFITEVGLIINERRDHPMTLGLVGLK